MYSKKILALLLISAVLLAAVLPVAAQDTDAAAEDTPAPLEASTDLFVTPFFRVNVRSGPGTEYTVLGVVTLADTLDITGQNEDGSWLRLNFSGQQGWVLADLMDVSGDLEAVPVAEAGAAAVLRSAVAAPAPEVEAEAEDAGPLEIMTFYNTNMRASFTTDAEVLATIPFDTVLAPQGRTNDSNWIKVTFDEQSGWVYAPILFFASGEVETLPVLATVTPVEESVEAE